MNNKIYLTRLFFLLFGVGILLFILSYSYPYLDFVANTFLVSLLGLTFIDILLVYGIKEPFKINRIVNKRLYLGDQTKIVLTLENTSNQRILFQLFEGFPIYLQERKKIFSGNIGVGKTENFDYTFKPIKRGEYVFGDVFIKTRSLLGLSSRGITYSLEQKVGVYPSVTQMKKYELMVFQQQKVMNAGIKKIRRIGNNSEFEQIKNYVQGDDLRTINWKASSRSGGQLMVNQYQEEKAQNLYCIIDKSRNMQMEFDDLSLLDHSINASLVLSNIALRKGDRAGLITFADKIGSKISADRRAGQMRRIQESLYNQKTLFKEGNFELLYNSIRRTVKTRSMLVLFTNFETSFSMRRTIPMLRQLNKKHLLVVVLFENADLQDIAYQAPKNQQELYLLTVAEQMLSQKAKMARELKQNGIQTVLTLPEELSVNTINKYLEMKAKGSI